MGRDDRFLEILKRSRDIDELFVGLDEASLGSVRITYSVPVSHPRSDNLESYSLTCETFSPLLGPTGPLSERNTCLMVSDAILNYPRVAANIEPIGTHVVQLPSSEKEVKTRAFLDDWMAKQGLSNNSAASHTIVAAGGGLLLNVAAFVAETLGSNLVLWPTTLLSMADGAGGKVRLNQVLCGKAYKHTYRSYYEPNAIYVDPLFLKNLPEFQLRCGMVEIIKHGIFQSEPLAEYLIAGGTRSLGDSDFLLKAALWAAALKQVCLEVDVEENDNGSKRILKAGHNVSDRIEEESGFVIPHGYAVAMGIRTELDNHGLTRERDLAEQLFRTFRIPTTLEEYERYIAPK